MQSTPQGVYYRNIWGKLFRIDSDKFLPVREATNEAQRTIQFTTTIPAADTNAGFPANVSGSLRLDGDVQRIKLSANLIANGQRQPTGDDQERFADNLASGYSSVRGLTLNFHDADGYVAIPTRRIAIPEEGWSRTVDDTGKTTAYEYNIRDDIDAKQAKSITSVLVGWSGVRPPPAPSVAPAPSPEPSQDPSTFPNADDPGNAQ